MEETTRDPGPSESETSSASWWSSGFTERLQSFSLASPEENPSTRDSACSPEQDQLSPLAASQILWETGAFSGVIPDGFYSVLPETKLKQLFHNIPPIDELFSMGLEGLKADVILVDSDKDKKLSKLKNFIVALVKGLHSNPTSMAKKIAGVVCNFYKRPASELSPAKSPVEDPSLVSENHVVQLLGQIKNGLCRPRAILFKVLADAVGFECKLMVVIYTVAQEGVRLEIPDGPLGKLISSSFLPKIHMVYRGCWAEPDQRPGCEEILSRLVECECTLLMPLCT